MKAARAEVRRLHSVATKLMDLILALDERRKSLEDRIAELEIMREHGVNVLTASAMLRRHKYNNDLADQEVASRKQPLRLS